MNKTNEDLIEALTYSIEKEVGFKSKSPQGNQFETYLGKGFINDLKGTITSKVEANDASTIKIHCLNGKTIAFVIIPKEQCIEAVFPERDKEGKIKRHRRTGILKPKYAHMWKAFITLTFAQYVTQTS